MQQLLCGFSKKQGSGMSRKRLIKVLPVLHEFIIVFDHTTHQERAPTIRCLPLLAHPYGKSNVETMNLVLLRASASLLQE